MLTKQVLKEAIVQEEIKDKIVKSWFFEDPKIVDEEVIELLMKYRPLLSKQILKELLRRYAEKVASVNKKT